MTPTLPCLPSSRTLRVATIAACLGAGTAHAVPEQPGKPQPPAPVEAEEQPRMVEVIVPGLVAPEEAERVRERTTINPTTAEFKRAEAQSLTPDATGAVRAPVYRSLKQAHAAGVNPEPVPIPAAAPMNATVERPLWAVIAGWSVTALLGLGALLVAVMGLRRWLQRNRTPADNTDD